MNVQFIFELFLSYIPPQSNPDHFIEIFDFHECTYGTVFYKGQKIFQYEDQDYHSTVTSYFNVEKMVNLGLDIKKANILFYDLSVIKDYSNSLSSFNYQESQFSPYSKLLKDFQADLAPIKAIIKSQEATYKKIIPNAGISFLQVDKF